MRLKRGRPVSGANLVNNLTGSQHAKRRVELVLQTITGQITIPQACAELNICASAFHKMRTRTLQEMVEGMEPRQVGRPAEQVGPEQQRIEELTAQIGQLEIQLQAARIREELALAGLVPNQRRSRKEATPVSPPSPPHDNVHPAGSAGAQNNDAPAGPVGPPALKKTNQPPTW